MSSSSPVASASLNNRLTSASCRNALSGRSRYSRRLRRASGRLSANQRGANAPRVSASSNFRSSSTNEASPRSNSSCRAASRPTLRLRPSSPSSIRGHVALAHSLIGENRGRVKILTISGVAGTRTDAGGGGISLCWQPLESLRPRRGNELSASVNDSRNWRTRVISSMNEIRNLVETSAYVDDLDAAERLTVTCWAWKSSAGRRAGTSSSGWGMLTSCSCSTPPRRSRVTPSPPWDQRARALRLRDRRRCARLLA